jgi:hypothetical protein
VNLGRRKLLVIEAGLSDLAQPRWAQTPAAGTLRRVGVLAPSTQSKEALILKPFYDEMHRLGWTEGRSIAYDAAYADDRHQDLPRLAAGFLVDPTEATWGSERSSLGPASKALGLTLAVGEVSNPLDFDAAMARLMAQGVEAIVAYSPLVTHLRRRLVALAGRKHVSVVRHAARMAEVGALFSYGASLADQLRCSAHPVAESPFRNRRCCAPTR